MYTIVPNASTFFKSQPLQSFELSSKDRVHVQPGTIYNTPVLVDAMNNHWRITIGSNEWYIFKPHWDVIKDSKALQPVPYEIVASKPTIVKRRPVQSRLLTAEEQFTVLPGHSIKTPIIKESLQQHWEIKIPGTVDNTWFVYHPHWTAVNLGINLDLATLRKIYPWTELKILEDNLPYLNKAMSIYKINLSKIRVAYFLAQIGHESGGLRFNLELASGLAYEGRKDLGNTQRGDGPRYKGRGFIQLTGRANYRNAGRALNIDLEGNPELARDIRYQSLIAAWFWNSRNLNLWADREDFLMVTRLINGGYNGLKDRQNYLTRAISVL